MNSAFLAYVLAHVANIADVNPSDVHTSLRGGSIVMNNVRLRKETMNKILPIPIVSGVTEELSVQVPNPTTANPVHVELRGAHLIFPIELAFPPAERTMEEILQDITPEGILGGMASQPEDVVVSLSANAEAAPSAPSGSAEEADTEKEDVDSEDQQERSSPPSSFTGDALDATERFTESDMQSVRSLDDEDLRSCRSDNETSDTDSLASGEDGAGDREDTSQSLGWFAYFREKATKSMEWIWQRPVEIVFRDLRLTVPCDEGRDISFELHIAEFAVTIQPLQTMGAQQMKLVTLTVRSVAVLANTGNRDTPTPKVAAVEEVSVAITKVYATRGGALLRTNVAVSFPSTVAVTADEETLNALVRCKVTRDFVLALPPYCRPHARLRNAPSLWPYVAACVIAKVRDERARYNFNSSHIRFYANARARYLQLLDDCHRTRNITGREQELAEAEQDLRYPDVILALRQRVQRRYAAKLSQGLRAVRNKTSVPVESPSLSGVKPLSSTHFDVRRVRLSLPAETVVEVHDTAVAVRDYETVATVGGVVLHTHGNRQSVKSTAQAATRPLERVSADVDKGKVFSTQGNGAAQNEMPANAQELPPLLRFSTRTEPEDRGGAVETRVEVAELGLRLRLASIHRTLVPLVDVLAQLGMKERVPVAALESSASANEAEAARVSQNFMLVVPQVRIELDMLTFLLRKLAVTAATVVATDQPVTFPKYGCTLTEMSIRNQDGTYLLSPVDIKMRGSSDAVLVSPVQVTVSMGSWSFVRSVRDRVQDLIHRVPPELFVKQAELAAAAPPPSHSTASATMPVTFGFLEHCRRSLPAWRDMNHSAQTLTVAGARFEFDPLDLAVSVSRLQVGRTTAPRPARGSDVACGDDANLMDRASFERTHGLHIRVKYVGVTVSYTRRITLSLACTNGIDIYSGSLQPVKLSSQKSPAQKESQGVGIAADDGCALRKAIVSRIPSITVTYAAYRERTRGSGLQTPASVPSAPMDEVCLAEMREFSLTSVEDYTAVAVGSVRLLNDGVLLEPVQALARTDTSATVTTLRPYRASFLQLSCCLREIVVGNAMAVEFPALVPAISALITFLTEEMVPVSAYQLFFSGFTDAALSITSVSKGSPNGCCVRWRRPTAPEVGTREAPSRRTTSHSSVSDAQSAELDSPIWLTINPPSLKDDGTGHYPATGDALASFGVVLPGVFKRTPPLVMTNDLKGLVIAFACPRFCIGVSTNDAPPHGSAIAVLTLEGLGAEVALGKMDFWAPDVQSVPPCPTLLTVEKIRADVSSGVCTARMGAADAKAPLVRVVLTDISAEHAVRNGLLSSSSAPVVRRLASQGPLSNGAASMPSIHEDGSRQHREGERWRSGMGGGSLQGFSDRAGSPGSESETASCVSVDEEHESLSLALGSWYASTNAARDVAYYRAVMMLINQCRVVCHQAMEYAENRTSTLAPPAFVHITTSIACQNFDMQQSGNIYLDGFTRSSNDHMGEEESLDIVVVDSCSFTWPNVNVTSCIVVCANTTVLFRNCVFKRASGDSDDTFSYVRTADEATGVFALQNCVEAEIHVDGTPTTPQVPQTSSPVDGSADTTGRQRVRNYTLTIRSGSFLADLTPSISLALEQAPASVTVSVKPHSSTAHIRNEGVRVVLLTEIPFQAAARQHVNLSGDNPLEAAVPLGTEWREAAHTPILSKFSFEVDASERHRSNAFTLVCSAAFGEVFVPLVPEVIAGPLSLVHQLTETPQGAHQRGAPYRAHGGGERRRRFVPQAKLASPSAIATQQPRDRMRGGERRPRLDVTQLGIPPRGDTITIPYAKWKVLCSLSLVPIQLGLPGGGLTVAQVTLSNAFFWTRRESARAEAQVEARLAFHDLAVWEFGARRPVNVSVSPSYLGMQGHMSPQGDCTIQATVSANDYTLASSQVRLLSTVTADAIRAVSVPAQRCDAPTDGAESDPQCSVRVTNDSGASLCLSTQVHPAPGRLPRGYSTSTRSTTTRGSMSTAQRVRSADGSDNGTQKEEIADISTRATFVSLDGDDTDVLISGVPALPSAARGELLCGPSAIAALPAHARKGGATASSVRPAPKTNMSLYGLEECAVAAEAHYVTLNNGTVLHVLSSLVCSPRRHLSHVVQIRSTFQVSNDTVFSLCLVSRYTQAQQVVLPKSMGSIPLSLLVCPDINVSIQSRTQRQRTLLDLRTPHQGVVREEAAVSIDESAMDGAEGDWMNSLREKLWAEETQTPAQVLRMAHERGEVPPPFQREFVSQQDGSKVYLSFEFTLQDQTVILHVRPTRPVIHNMTAYPLTLEVMSPPPRQGSHGAVASDPVGGNGGGTLLLSEDLAPGAEVSLYQLSPAVSYTTRFHVRTHAETFITDTDEESGARLLGVATLVKDGDDDDGDGQETVGRKVSLRAHYARPSGACQFELECVQVYRHPGNRTRVWQVKASHMALLLNTTSEDVAVTVVASAAPAGSLGSKGLCAKQFGHVPTGKELVLRARGTAPSETFEVESGYAGGVIACRHERNGGISSGRSGGRRSDKDRSAYFLLLRPADVVADVPLCPVFELTAPLRLCNTDTQKTIIVRHYVYAAGEAPAGLFPEQVQRKNDTGVEDASTGWVSHSPQGTPPLVGAEVSWLGDLEVPPLGVRECHQLSANGFTNAFCVSCDGGASFSEPVESDLLPGTNWAGRVLCSTCCKTLEGSAKEESGTGMVLPTHQHTIRVIKKTLCDGADIVIGPAEPFDVRLVNFTDTSFVEASKWDVAPAHADVSATCRDAMDVTERTGRNESLGASPLRLTEDFGGTRAVVELPVAVNTFATTAAAPRGRRVFLVGPKGPRKRFSVVIAENELLVGQGILTAGQLRQQSHSPSSSFLGAEDTSSHAIALVLRVELQVAGHSCRLLDTSGFPVRLSFESLAVWANYGAGAMTLQAGIKAVSADNTPARETPVDPWGADEPSHRQQSPRYVLEPVSLDVSVRDIRWLPASKVSVQSLRTNCSNVVVTVSDLFIAQVLRLSTECSPASTGVPPPSLDTAVALLQRTSGPSVSSAAASSSSSSPRLLVAKATLAEIPIILNWDRSTARNVGLDTVLESSAANIGRTFFTLTAFIPSLHHASLRIPKLQFTDLSTTSPADFFATVQQIVVVEVVKQIPRVVSTIGFFPQSSSILGKVTSKLGAFLFGSDPEDTDLTELSPRSNGRDSTDQAALL